MIWLCRRREELLLWLYSGGLFPIHSHSNNVSLRICVSLPHLKLSTIPGSPTRSWLPQERTGFHFYLYVVVVQVVVDHERNLTFKKWHYSIVKQGEKGLIKPCSPGGRAGPFGPGISKAPGLALEMILLLVLRKSGKHIERKR